MRLPPLVARVRVRTPRHALRLWLPLFLVWALLAVLLLPLLLVLRIAALVVPRWSLLALVRGGCAVLGEARGTRVLVERPGAEIFVSLS
ncbi:MAG TPA: hypothetical protein VML50_05260 [Anaeromyxobacter sp.]|nr:hypothetical protein [Anaeromyxobacter sp.]